MDFEIPLWVVASLGRKVALVDDFDDGVRVYPAGTQGTLMTLRGDSAPVLWVDVCLNPDDPTDWERLAVWQIRPPTEQISFELDIERGAIAF